MTYNVFGGTLNLTQSINVSCESFICSTVAGISLSVLKLVDFPTDLLCHSNVC